MTTTAAFRHDALLYEGLDGFVAATVPFVDEGLAAGEAVLVMAPGDRIDALRDVLGDDADRIRLADMTVVGRNPARIIPAWQRFVDECVTAGRGFRGVGEPVWAGRSDDELDECHGHEALLNHAFEDAPFGWSLLCPYDVAALEPSVVEAATRTHRHVVDAGTRGPGGDFRAVDAAMPFARPLPPPPGDAEVHAVERRTISALRAAVQRRALAAGLDQRSAGDLVLAANEVASNCIQHGEGGTAAIWETGSWLCVEARGGGLITDPLVGRVQPGISLEGGRGVWLANQVCDLVRIHSTPAGTAVRLQMRLA